MINVQTTARRAVRYKCRDKRDHNNVPPSHFKVKDLMVCIVSNVDDYDYIYNNNM